MEKSGLGCSSVSWWSWSFEICELVSSREQESHIPWKVWLFIWKLLKGRNFSLRNCEVQWYMHFKTVLFTENKLTNNPTVNLCKLEDGYLQHLFKSKNLLTTLPKFFPKKRLKGQHSLQGDGAKLENRWLKGGSKLNAYLFGLGLCISVCLCICMCTYFYVLEKLTIHSIWTSSCLGKASSTMDNGVSDICFILEFCFVKIADGVWKGVKFGRSSLLVCNLHDVPPPVSNGDASSWS